MTKRCSGSCLSVAIAVWAVCGTAAAGGDADNVDGADSKAEAARLFEEAKAHMDRREYDVACPKLAKSLAEDPQIGTMLNLAWCYENVGKTASAWSMWLDAAVAAAAQGQSDREQFARARAGRLEPGLLRVTVSVKAQPDADSLRVELDGKSLAKTQWGAPTPIDPGEHWVRAGAQGRRAWTVRVDVTPDHVPSVTVPVLEAEGQNERRLPNPPHPEANWLRTAAVFEAGASFAVAGVGVAFVALGEAQQAAARPYCVGDNCSPPGQSDRSQAVWDGNMASVAFGVSGCALLGAGILWLAGSSPSRVQVAPGVAAGGWSLTLKEDW